MYKDREKRYQYIVYLKDIVYRDKIFSKDISLDIDKDIEIRDIDRDISLEISYIYVLCLYLYVSLYSVFSSSRLRV